jgi:hypothetical protein
MPAVAVMPINAFKYMYLTALLPVDGGGAP